MADERNNKEPAQGSSETENQRAPEAEKGKGADLVDEHGEPLEKAENEVEEDHEHPKQRPLYKRPAFLIGAAIMLLIALVFGIRYWLYARSHETTDDAFVDGHIIQVSPKVSGYVLKVYVNDNQPVNAGDLLAELDPRDLEAKLAQANAALNAGLAQEKQAQTQVTLTRKTTNANVVQAAAGVQQARSGVTGARAGAASERSRTNQTGAAVGTAEANLQQARAQVSAAEAEAVR